MSVDVPELSLFGSALSDLQGLDFENQDGESLFPEVDQCERSECLNNNSAMKLNDSTFLIGDEKVGQNVMNYLNMMKERSERYSGLNEDEKSVSTSSKIRLSPSHSDHSEEFDDGRLSMSKNAITARENRQKKKKYINGLEQSVKQLSGENHHLKCKVKKLQGNVFNLEEEVKYLKGVIANQSTLSMLLKNIKSTPGVEFSSSLSVKSDDKGYRVGKIAGRNRSVRGVKRVASTQESDSDNSSSDEESSEKLNIDHDYASCTSDLPQKKMKRSHTGVCLHVSNKSVSLEFCSSCNSNASSESRKTAS